jgi:hypothetical protein
MPLFLTLRGATNALPITSAWVGLKPATTNPTWTTANHSQIVSRLHRVAYPGGSILTSRGGLILDSAEGLSCQRLWGGAFWMTWRLDGWSFRLLGQWGWPLARKPRRKGGKGASEQLFCPGNRQPDPPARSAMRHVQRARATLSDLPGRRPTARAGRAKCVYEEPSRRTYRRVRLHAAAAGRIRGMSMARHASSLQIAAAPRVRFGLGHLASGGGCPNLPQQRLQELPLLDVEQFIRLQVVAGFDSPERISHVSRLALPLR